MTDETPEQTEDTTIAPAVTGSPEAPATAEPEAQQPNEAPSVEPTPAAEAAASSSTPEQSEDAHGQGEPTEVQAVPDPQSDEQAVAEPEFGKPDWPAGTPLRPEPEPDDGSTVCPVCGHRFQPGDPRV